MVPRFQRKCDHFMGAQMTYILWKLRWFTLAVIVMLSELPNRIDGKPLFKMEVVEGRI